MTIYDRLQALEEDTCDTICRLPSPGTAESQMQIAVVTGVIPACDDSDPFSPKFFSGSAQLQKINYANIPATTTGNGDITVYSILTSDINVGTLIEVEKDNAGQWWAIPPEPSLTISLCHLAAATGSSFATVGTVSVTCGSGSMFVANPMHLQGDVGAPVTLTSTGSTVYLTAIAQEYQRRQVTISTTFSPGGTSATDSVTVTDPNKHGGIAGSSGFATFWFGAWVWEGGGCVS